MAEAEEKMPVILLVEDNDDHAFLAKQTLLRSGTPVSIHTARNGGEALQWLRNSGETPLLVLLDLEMPGSDGIDFLTRLRAEQPQFSAPVFLLTAEMDEEKIQQVFRLGVAGYVPKPIHRADNLKRLQNYFDLLEIPMRVWPYCNIPADYGMIG